MALIDLLKKIPFTIYPYYMANAGFIGVKAASYIAYQSVIKRKNMFIRPPIKHGLKKNIFKWSMAGRPPDYKVAMVDTLTLQLHYFASIYTRYAQDPDKMIWHEDLVPPEIIIAMGLIPFMVEMPGILAPIISPDETHEFIDIMENAGYPGDICTLPKTTLGMVLDGVFPPPKAIITSNSPCDGGMSSYLPMEQETGAPTFRLDFPWDVYTPRAQEYCQKEIWRMIRFLEDMTGQTLDMDRLKKVCEKRNETLEMTYDLWDMMSEKPSPIGGDVLFLSHSSYYGAPGTEMTRKVISNVVDAAKTMREKGIGPIEEEKYRAILWNPPTAMFPEIYKWMEETYGLVVVMDMLTFHRNPIIDTSSEQSMMRDITEIMSKGPMGRHTRGPSENFFDDLFWLYKNYSADLIIMAGHLNCKNTRALLSMFRDYCRRDEIPLMIIDYDLSDARVVSVEGIKRQVADFMDTVMTNNK
jgi:benzoyl-CoA reductase/2-hydroxyglutaryl-CoA dehydratase subunit BcrC/BadD/HgdB